MQRRTSGVASLLFGMALIAGCSGGGSSESKETTAKDTTATTASATTATTAAATTATTASGGKGSSDGGGGGGGSAAPMETAPLTAGYGFEVPKHGFPFENYGNSQGYSNLTAAEVQRMFGDAACAKGSGPTCTLTPPAEAWMKQQNEGMNGGHCEGMAVVALLLQQGKIDASKLGGASAAAMPIQGNEALQREIAYWFVTQSLQPTQNQSFKAAPVDIVAKLREWFAAGSAADTYTVGFYKRGFKDGHAVTAVGLGDKPGGNVDILVYDNNYPNQVRAISVDMKANTWVYSGSPNPAQAEGRYEGDAESKTLEVTPTSARLQQQVCPFCGEATTAAAEAKGRATGRTTNQSSGQLGSGSKGSALAAPTQVFLDAAAYEAGVTFKVQAVGGGTLAGVTEIHPRGGEDLWDKDTPPILQVPAGTAFQVVIDATAVKAAIETDVAIVAPGLSGGISGISMSPGQRDTLVVEPARKAMKYTTSSDESPTMYFGVDGEPDNYEFSLGGVELGKSGGTLEGRLDTTAKKLIARTTGSDTATILFYLERINDDADESLENDGVQLKPNETLVVEYGSWKGNKSSVTAGIDTNGDDAIDTPLEIEDEK
ncbi:MAG: hypothetical protein ACKO91_15960 [Acidimicrobiales bacterium]